MSALILNQQITNSSPRLEARIAGTFYAINVVTSLVAFSRAGGPRVAFVCGLIATAAYVAVTAIFYVLFKPVNKRLSLIAAGFSLLGCAPGILSPFHWRPYAFSPLVFFGAYCLLIGYLILRSTFLPRIFGVLMVLAGIGWLTFISPSFAKSLSPYNYYPGGIGEISLCLWLLAVGVNGERWTEQARNPGTRSSAQTVMAG